MPKQDATNSTAVVVNQVPDFIGKKPKGKLAKFCREYIVDFNILQAAKRTGYAASWANSAGSRIVREQADYINWLQKIYAVENAKFVSMSQEEILHEMEQIARANIQDYFTWETVEMKVGKKTAQKKIRTWKDPADLTRDQAAAVKRVVLSAEGKVMDYILYDKDNAQFNLGRHIGMFSEKVILEHRHKHLHVKMDFSKVPIELLEKSLSEMEKYLPAHAKEAS